MPPIEIKSIKKKVNDRNESVFTNKVIVTNSTNSDNATEEDDNGNRASVADLCKKFDDKSQTATKNEASNNLSSLKASKTKSPKTIENCEISASATTKNINSKKVNNGVNKKSSSSVSAITINGKKTDSLTSNKCLSNVDVLQSKFEVINKDVVENGTNIDREDVGFNSNKEDIDLGNQKSSSRVNSFASYISTKDFEKPDDKVNGSNSNETTKNDMDNKDNTYLGKILAQNVSNLQPLFYPSSVNNYFQYFRCGDVFIQEII